MSGHGRQPAGRTIAVVGAGDMGSGVGRALVDAGFDVVTCLTGRSAHSRALADGARMRDVGSLASLVETADLVLSILPPAAATSFAAAVLEAMQARARYPVFADCNAVSPATMRSIAAPFTRAGAVCIDVGIVGRPPRGENALATRIYVAGPDREIVTGLEVPGLQMIDMGPDIGRASAIKMVYASLNKGIDALLTAVLLAARSLGVHAEFMEELGRSQTVALARMESRVPYLAATAERFAPEMREIAATYSDAGVTPAFHEGAAWIYEQLSRTPLAAETRASLPERRSLEEALAVFAAVLERSQTQ